MSETKSENQLTDSFKFREILIDENKYLIGVKKNDDVRHILLTNSTDFYEEKLSKEDIEKRCEELNPLLNDFNFEDIVDDLLEDIPKYTISSTLNFIELETKIEDGRFWFNINFTKCNPEYFNDSLSENFYFCFSELYHRYKCLLDIVKKKDREITEYKARGVELLRKSLITEPFTEDLFHTKLKNTNSTDKLNAFLSGMDFYNTIKDLKCNNHNIKQESKSIKAEQSSNEQSPVKSNRPNKSIKRLRPKSSDVRCAAPAKIEKEPKACKRSLFKLL